MSNVYELQPRFATLFSGLDEAFGTGRGSWVKRKPLPEDFIQHLQGRSVGIGIAPLRPDNTVMFAAIDLDEPDFEAAIEMQTYIPGRSFIERSRSGNAHVWVFFKSPCPAWLAMGILREACLAAGKQHVEVFPKNHDFSRVTFGNYINLPYHGDNRGVFVPAGTGYGDNFPPAPDGRMMMSVEEFVGYAEENRIDPLAWEKRAAWMMLSPPEQREQTSTFGEQRALHVCAEHIISGDAGPIMEGHRSVVYFSLAKMLTNWEQVDHDEAAEILRCVNEDSAPASIPDEELMRILGNAERGRFTSTGCDDPLFAPFAHPDCPIANPRRR